MRAAGDRPCDDCGTPLETGLEPVSPDDEDCEPGRTHISVDWCPDPDCPSNHALRGLTRLGPNLYVCAVCAAELSGPMRTVVFDHRRSHTRV